MTKQFGTIILLFILSASPLMARAPLQRPSMGQVVESEHLDRALKQNLLEPLTQGELMNLLKKTRKDPDVVYRTLNERGVDFDLDRKIEKKMRNAGAGDDMLKAIWKAKPTGRNEKTATLTSSNGVPLHTKNEEAMSYKTMEDESDPDGFSPFREPRKAG